MVKRFVSASELAEMGFCEKKVLLTHRLGRRVSVARLDAQSMGLEAHGDFHRDAFHVAPAVKSSVAKPWCFIASELFGQGAWETGALRMGRDRILRKSAAGRAFIGFYYRRSPGIARWLHRHPRSRAISRATLRPVAAVLRRIFEWNDSRRGAKL